MIVYDINDLPDLSDKDLLCIDVETASFKPTQFGTAFDGISCVCGYAICDEELNSWYLPTAHYAINKDGTQTAPEDYPSNLSRKQILKYLEEVINRPGLTIVNHNIKFDARYWWRDGIFTSAPWEERGPKLLDTMVLARLVDCDALSYSLDNLSRVYLGERKGTDAVKEFLKSHQKVDRKDCKDYGLVPPPILGPYAEKDVILTMRLYKTLLSKLREESQKLWETESRVLEWMLHWEIKGVTVDQRKIKLAKMSILREMLDLHQKACELSGDEAFEPSSDDDLTRVFVGKYDVVPKNFTKKAKKPQWNGMALRTIKSEKPEHQEVVSALGKTIAEYKNLMSFKGSFCDGWLNRIGQDGALHADFRVAGTGTGRLSCSDPNLFNVPPRAEDFVPVPEGYALVAWDYSQIEYRIFGHYTNDPFIVNSYLEDDKADFHGLLAGELGVDRQFAKQLNFSFLYGMGKEKLLTNIAGILTLKADESDEMKEKMRLMAYGAGTSISERAKQLESTEETRFLAEKIYEKYHRRFPSIRKFQRRVYNAIRVRGWIKNYFGRYYDLPMQAVHKGVNFIVQGSAADLFKNRIVAVFDELLPQYDFYMLTNVYDSVITVVKKEQAEEFYYKATPILEADLGLKVPIRVDGKVSTTTWARVVEVDESRGGFSAALREAETAKARLAGLSSQDWDDSKTSGRYDFSGTGS